jgi:hypothetical protein
MAIDLKSCSSRRSSHDHKVPSERSSLTSSSEREFGSHRFSNLSFGKYHWSEVRLNLFIIEGDTCADRSESRSGHLINVSLLIGHSCMSRATFNPSRTAPSRLFLLSSQISLIVSPDTSRQFVMASFVRPAPFFRSFRARLSPEFFTCRLCLRSRGLVTEPFRRSSAYPRLTSDSKPLNSYLATLRGKFRGFPSQRTAFLSTTVGHIAEEEAARAQSRFPDVSSKAVAYWLLGSAASVFGIVIFGGLTRLTESGCVHCSLHCG